MELGCIHTSIFLSLRILNKLILKLSSEYSFSLFLWVQMLSFEESSGTSLAVQRLRLCASNAGDAGLTPGRGTKIPHAAQHSQKVKKKKKKKSLLTQDHVTGLPHVFCYLDYFSNFLNFLF